MRHPYLLSRKNTGLLIIDVQEKFRPVISDFDAIVYNVVRLVLGCQIFKLLVLVTEQYPKGLGQTDERIRKQFSVLKVIEKLALAATDCPQFWEQATPLGLKTAIVCGIETHVCVNQTVLGLIQKGYTVHVVVDAIGCRNAQDGEIALRKLEKAGAILTTTETVLFELAQKAGTEIFKTIQKMVKSRKGKQNSGATPAAADDSLQKSSDPVSAPAAAKKADVYRDDDDHDEFDMLAPPDDDIEDMDSSEEEIIPEPAAQESRESDSANMLAVEDVDLDELPDDDDEDDANADGADEDVQVDDAGFVHLSADDLEDNNVENIADEDSPEIALEEEPSGDENIEAERFELEDIESEQNSGGEPVDEIDLDEGEDIAFEDDALIDENIEAETAEAQESGAELQIDAESVEDVDFDAAENISIDDLENDLEDDVLDADSIPDEEDDDEESDDDSADDAAVDDAGFVHLSAEDLAESKDPSVEIGSTDAAGENDAEKKSEGSDENGLVV